MLYCLICQDKENAIETRMQNREDHLKYVNGWIKNLENKPEQVIKAINKSTKAIEHLDSLQVTEEKKEVA